MHATPRPRRAGARTAALAALTVAGSALFGVPAVAVPGENGDVKIHAVGKDTAEPDNDPHVCGFYLDAFNFDPNETADWTIVAEPPTTTGVRRNDSITLDDTGAGHTDAIHLPNGHYRLTWVTPDGDGEGKFKTFWVDCAPGQGNGGSNGGPNGGPPAGGGGLARDAAIGPVAGAATVGAAAVGGVVWFRLRRRTHGAA
ncbi:hypothetical protein [Streptomyces sp. NPDC001388]|uniref:hypothetical protein n=1 Tax=Streptomyces sp. NPDC001388 TaxID=3364568 RepID=UPI00368CBB69